MLLAPSPHRHMPASCPRLVLQGGRRVTETDMGTDIQLAAGADVGVKERVPERRGNSEGDRDFLGRWQIYFRTFLPSGRL